MCKLLFFSILVCLYICLYFRVKKSIVLQISGRDCCGEQRPAECLCWEAMGTSPPVFAASPPTPETFTFSAPPLCTPPHTLYTIHCWDRMHCYFIQLLHSFCHYHWSLQSPAEEAFLHIKRFHSLVAGAFHCAISNYFVHMTFNIAPPRPTTLTRLAMHSIVHSSLKVLELCVCVCECV